MSTPKPTERLNALPACTVVSACANPTTIGQNHKRAHMSNSRYTAQILNRHIGDALLFHHVSHMQPVFQKIVHTDQCNPDEAHSMCHCCVASSKLIVDTV